MSFQLQRHPCQITDILYDLVTQALGGKSVKCVVNEYDECVYTTDVETLLSSLDTEHPEIEIILQSLKSHKAQHGEGAKTLLFMVTRIAKAVKQLEQLGIAHCISTTIMRQALDKLAEKVHRIGIPVITSEIESSRQSMLKDCCVVNVEPSEYEKRDKMLDRDNALGHFHDKCRDSNLECLTLDHHNGSEKCQTAMHDSIAVDGENEKLGCQSFMPLEENDLKGSESVDGESVTSAMESDAVYLKMSKCLSHPEGLQQDTDVDDVDWFFDKGISSSDSIRNESHNMLDVEGNLEICSLNYRNQVMDIILDGKKSNISEFDSDLIIRNRTDKRKSESLKSLGKNDHDSDFEDCFEEEKNQNCVAAVVESEIRNQNLTKSSEYRWNKDAEDLNEKKLNIKQFSMSKDFEESSHVYYSFSKSQCQLPDEFDDCFDKESPKDDKGELDKYESQQGIQKIIDTTTGVSLPGHSGAKRIAKVDLESVAPNVKLNQNHSFDKDASALSQITKLNSLLKGIASKSTHSAKQVHFSTRHKLSLETSDENENRNASDSTTSEVSSIGMDVNHKETTDGVGNSPDGCLHSSPAHSSGAESSRTDVSDLSKVNEINTILKRLSVQNPSVNMAQIMSSSRHLEHAEGSKCQETISVERLHEPNQESLHQNVDTKNCAILGKDHAYNDVASDLNLGSRENRAENYNEIPVMLSKKWDVVNESIMNDSRLKNDFPMDASDVIHGVNDTQIPKGLQMDVDNVTGSRFAKELSTGVNIVTSKKCHSPLQIPRDIYRLARESIDDDLVQLVTQVYRFQGQSEIAESEKRRLDLSRVHCVSVQSSCCVRQAVRGLVVSCGSHTLEMIEASSRTRNTLLVNGDLKLSFVHKGHKPVAAKRIVVEDGTAAGLKDSMSDGKEHSWAIRVVAALTRLQVGVLLVKGSVSDTLCDMLYKEHIIVVPRVPFRVLGMVSECIGVLPVTYIEDATKSDVCRLSYQPLTKGWMDDRGDVHCLHLTDLPQIQTVVLLYPSTQSCQLAEEKVWKCLYRLAGAVRDGVVLPGHGKAELWGQGQVKVMVQDWPGEFCPQRDLVLQALADVFHDYHAFVGLNVKSVTATGSSQDILRHPPPPPPHSQSQPTVGGVSGCGSRNKLDDRYILHSFPPCVLEEHSKNEFGVNWLNDKECVENLSLNFVSSGVCGEIERRDLGCEKKDENGDREFETGGSDGESKVEGLCQEYFQCQCDSLKSKMSSWSSAVDLVQVLMSLDSLVVTGASSSDLGVGDVLL